MEIICQVTIVQTQPLLKSGTYKLQKSVAPSMHCRSWKSIVSHNVEILKIGDIPAAIESIVPSGPSVHCRSGWKSFVSDNVEAHPLLTIRDIHTAIKSCMVVRMELICQSQSQNTPASDIEGIHAAIESVTPSVHCRSDGNHLSVTMSETHPLLVSATYLLQSNQLRQACIVVPDGTHCQSQCRNALSSEIGDILAAIESVAPSVRCRSGGNH
jgi:hypothetical protein